MEKLFDKTFAVLDRGVRIFLLMGDESALVIDTGMTGLDIDELVSEHTSWPYTVLNTHADRDHIASNSQFEECFMHPSEMAFYKNVQNGTCKVNPVFEGDIIDLGNRELEIIHLPGHTPGSITVLDRNNRCLIGGDPIQEDGDIFMFGPQRNMTAYIASLKKLDKRTDFDYIYPSHAKEKINRTVIPQLIEGAEKIMSGEIKGEPTERFGNAVGRYDEGVTRFLSELK